MEARREPGDHPPKPSSPVSQSSAHISAGVRSPGCWPGGAIRSAIAFPDGASEARALIAIDDQVVGGLIVIEDLGCGERPGGDERERRRNQDQRPTEAPARPLDRSSRTRCARRCVRRLAGISRRLGSRSSSSIFDPSFRLRRHRRSPQSTRRRPTRAAELGPGRAGANGPDREIERRGGLRVGELRPGAERQHLALARGSRSTTSSTARIGAHR